MLESQKINFIWSTILVLFLICKINAQFNGRRGVCTGLAKNSNSSNSVGIRNGTSAISIIEICCSGWKKKLTSGPLECEPLCEDGCPGGTCTGPNLCTCKPGYIKDRKFKCVPTCPIGCKHGVCQKGRCVCLAGFTLSPNGKMCEPVCHGGCGAGGTCVAPFTCRCSEGYKMDEKTKKCIKLCEKGHVHRNGQCVPSCPRGCKNGVCTQPNVCTCPNGWFQNKQRTECIAHCSPQCQNADCTAPNICTCKKGYVADFNHKHRCYPHCTGGCQNGKCVGPNFCACNDGYVRHPKDSSLCTPDVNVVRI